MSETGRSQSNDPDATAFGLLTERHTFLVLDTEYSPAAAGGPQRLIQLGTVPVTAGRAGRPTTRLVKPGEPITNSHVHQITDSHVAGKRDFAGVEASLDALLTSPPGALPVVLVGHFLTYDVNVLRGEYQRLGRDIPEVTTLDTVALARYVAHDLSRGRGLADVSRSLGIGFTPEHHAGKDAAATAKVLIALLRRGAEAGLVDLDDILDAVGSTTHKLEPPEQPTRPMQEEQLEISSAHQRTHSRLLPSDPTDDDVIWWLQAARDCSRNRCPLARDRAAVAVMNAPERAAELLAGLTDAANLATLGAGQAGTHAGMLAELIPTALPKTGAALRWWRKTRTVLLALDRCHRGDPDASCPDCWAARPCPLDTLHQVVAYTECQITADGHIVRNALSRLLENEGGGIRLWATTDPDVAGYAAWLVIDFLESQSARTRTTAVLDLAVQVGLDRTEPRIARLHAQALVNQGDLAGVDAVLDGCPRPAGNTDDGWNELRDWTDGPYADVLARAQPARPRVRTLPRQARPLDRVRPNRFKR